MANWALVENNNITTVLDSLPKNWKNVSGLDKSSDKLDFLKSLGWYSIVKNHSEYNSATHYISKKIHTFADDQVTETIEISKKNFEPARNVGITEDLDPEEIIWNSMDPPERLRSERNKRLAESDWTQLPDVQASLTEEQKGKWLQYRQELRDITELYPEGICNLYDIVWPEA
jgi:hypothetical protein